jgi:hypothetical protein
MGTKGRSWTAPYPKRAKGIVDGAREGSRLKIACSFQADLFRKIESTAKRNAVSFREQVRRLCEAALSETTSR